MRRAYPRKTILQITGLVMAAGLVGLAPACNALTGIGDFEVDPALGSGAGGGAPCSTALDCPGEDNACQARSCVSGRCQLEVAPEGPLAKGQTAGDCMRVECDAEGQPRTVTDTSDPLEDGLECTLDTCNSDGTSSSELAPQGYACNQNGGKVCDGTGKCVQCNFSADCAGGGPCSSGKCVPPECGDASKNGDESDIDCGGPVCAPCGTGKSCGAHADCESKVCIAGTCQEATCGDATQNADETDVDCGGPTCDDCADGKGCLQAGDCVSNVCMGGQCQVPKCDDGVQNGGESDVDCGGPNCGGCSPGETCSVHADCLSEACIGGKCASIVQIAAGTTHACVLLGDGTVRCWGANVVGEVGDGTTVEKLGPTPVKNLVGVTQISLGINPNVAQGAHSCARLTAGTVSCWGRNTNGQFGNGTTANSSLPKAASLNNIAQVAAGGRHTCARLGTGAVRCWGANGTGQLGNGTTTSSTTPAAAVANVTATSIGLGDAHGCAVLATGEMRCWGDGAYGQMGVGTTADKLTPALVTGLSMMTRVEGGNGFTCALDQGSLLRCWGHNVDGQLGLGNVTQQNSPMVVPGLMNVTGLSLGAKSGGGGHSCFVMAGGELRCVGSNAYGELGVGDTTSLSTPKVVNLPPVAEVAAGMQFTCARLVTGAIRCWGRNDVGQLGIGVKGAEQTTPVPVVFP